MPVSLKTIADECQVSRQAVSNALTDKGRLAPETRERILRTAKELGYRPNSIARTMQSGRFGSVALLLSTDGSSSWMPDSLLAGINDELARHDLHLIIARLPDEKLVSEGFVPKLLREWSCDGVLINYIYDVPERLRDLIDDYGIPSVWLNFKRQRDCVYPDDYRAALEATQRLLGLGHRHIAYVEYTTGGAARHYSVRDRERGYTAAMRRAGCAPRVIRNVAGLPHEQLVELSRQWLALPSRPTAVITYGEGETVAVTLAAQSLGLRIPDDLAVITFHWGDVVVATMRTTYVFLPEYELGAAAVRMLLRKIEKPLQSLPPQAIRCGTMDGRSIGPPALG